MTLQRVSRPNRKRPGPPRRGRVRNRAYMKFVTDQPCVICEISRAELAKMGFTGDKYDITQTLHTEAAHVGVRGMAQKCSDLETIPLCGEHHRTGKDSHHVLGKRFWEHHGIDRQALIARLNAAYGDL